MSRRVRPTRDRSVASASSVADDAADGGAAPAGRRGACCNRAMLCVGFITLLATLPIAAVVAGVPLHVSLRGTTGHSSPAASAPSPVADAALPPIHALATGDVLGGSLRGETLRFRHYARDEPPPNERLCVGAACAAISFLMVDPQSEGTDKILDFVVRAEATVQELFAMLLVSRGCSRIPTDSEGARIVPWCAHDAAGTARAAPPIVVDVGANAGFYTLFSAAAGARVVSFDPQPHCAHFVRAGVKLSGFGDRVRVINAFAAANDSDTGVAVRLRSGCWGTFPTPDDTAALLSHQEFDALDGNRSVDVPAVSIVRTIKELAAQAAGDEGVLVVKIDAEGAEDALIAALDNAGVLKAGLVKNFIVEINSRALRRNYRGSACALDVTSCYADLFARFKAVGYVLLTSMSSTFIPISEGDIVELAQTADSWVWADIWWALPKKGAPTR